MIRMLSFAATAFLAASPAYAEPTWHLAQRPMCPPNASCIGVLPVHSGAPAPMSLKPETVAPSICVSNVMGGLKDEGAKICEAFLASGKGSRRERATALVNLGHWYRLRPDQIMKPVRAIEAWDKAIAEDPTFAEPHAAKGGLAAFDDKQVEAATFYDEALSLDHNHWRALMGKAYLMRRQAKFEKAVELARKAVAMAPDVGVAHQLLGAHLEAAGHKEAALVEYRKATDRYHGEFRRLPGLTQQDSPWAALADLEMRMGNFDTAIEAINHEIEGVTGRNVEPVYYLQRAVINEKASKAIAAAEDYDKAIAMFGPGFRQAEEYRARAAMLRASVGNSADARDNFRDLIRSGKLQSILRVQVFLNNQGFDEVPIDGKPSVILDRALDSCLADKNCTAVMGRAI